MTLYGFSVQKKKDYFTIKMYIESQFDISSLNK